jgi:glucose/arabinose dehydrogenase
MPKSMTTRKSGDRRRKSHDGGRLSESEWLDHSLRQCPLRRYRRFPASLLVAIFVLGLLAVPTVAQPVPPPREAPSADRALPAGEVRVRHIVSGLSNPLGIVNAGDGTDRLFVLEQRGTVRVIENRALKAGFFLDLRGVAGGLSSHGERGLLGLAFHPNFENNRYLFAYYTDGGGDLVITELRANVARTRVRASTADPLLKIEHSARTNHNGGQLLFGPGGNLYIFTGDGGGAGDPDENGQDKAILLGKTLRIDPNRNGGYTIPSSNPYHGSTPGRGEIWSIGLRNPWRASFDRETDALWIADVGQGRYEEINREPAGAGGRNYGWDCREGFQSYETIGCGSTFQQPLAAYSHVDGNCSVTGGYVYRGNAFPDFRGHYVFGDFCSGRIWTVRAAADSPATLKQHQNTTLMISSFGEAENGELWLTDWAGGRAYRVIAP